MTNINNNLFLRQSQIQQSQINKVEKDIEEKQNEQTSQTSEQNTDVTPQENFVERGNVLFDSMEYIAKASASSLKATSAKLSATEMQQQSIDTLKTVLNIEDESSLQDVKFNKTTGKITSFKFNGKTFTLGYNGNNISSLTAKNSAGKTAQTITIGYKNNNYSTIDITNYNETGKYKTSRRIITNILI